MMLLRHSIPRIIGSRVKVERDERGVRYLALPCPLELLSSRLFVLRWACRADWHLALRLAARIARANAGQPATVSY
jgi:hypothetical protein